MVLGWFGLKRALEGEEATSAERGGAWRDASREGGTQRPVLGGDLGSWQCSGGGDQRTPS